MSSSWSRNWGNLRTFVGNSMGGVRGGSSLAAWVVASSLAYYLWVKPSQDLKRLQLEKQNEMRRAKENSPGESSSSG